jgi:Tol biopolymer transport system component
MSRTISQTPTLRRLARVYRRMLALSVAAALAACEGATDALAPDAADDSSEPARAPSGEPVASLISDHIAFSGFTANGTNDIWTIGPQGGTALRLTSFSGMENEPARSFDRKQIAFMRTRNGGQDVYLMNADGTNGRWARPASAPYTVGAPSWSPNGTHLLVGVNYQSGSYVAKLDLATGNLAFLAPTGVFAVEGWQPIYHPTGSIFHLDASGKTIKRFTPGGSQGTVLAAGIYLSDLAISPDGTRLAYAAALTNVNTEIYVLNLATNVTKRLTNSAGRDASPTWSPDGTKLAFHSYRSGEAQIWTMNSSTGGNLTRITNRTYGARYPAWLR